MSILVNSSAVTHAAIRCTGRRKTKPAINAIGTAINQIPPTSTVILNNVSPPAVNMPIWNRLLLAFAHMAAAITKWIEST